MKNNINAKVFCRKNVTGTLNFFLEAKNEEMYLFTTKYYSYNVYQEYRNGRRIEKAFGKTSKIRQQKLNERILRMAKYAACENSLDLFEKPVHKKRGDADYEYEIA